jgi:methyl-accepting chemotaxis protein
MWWNPAPRRRVGLEMEFIGRRNGPKPEKFRYRFRPDRKDRGIRPAFHDSEINSDEPALGIYRRRSFGGCVEEDVMKNMLPRNPLRNLKFAGQMMTITVSLAILAVCLAGGASYYEASGTVERLVQRRIEALRDSRQTELLDLFDEFETDLKFWATNPYTGEALTALEFGWNIFPGDQADELQRLYTTDNPNPPGTKDLLEAATDGSVYSTAHAAYHPVFKRLKDVRGYYDVFLFSMNGDLIYSVYKEPDFATNFESGVYSSSGLGEVFRLATEKRAGDVAFVDFAAYAPSAGAPASFMASPIFKDGQPVGVLAIQIPIRRIDTILARGPAPMG